MTFAERIAAGQTTTKKLTSKQAKKWKQRELVANTKPTVAPNELGEYNKDNTRRERNFINNVKL